MEGLTSLLSEQSINFSVMIDDVQQIADLAQMKNGTSNKYNSKYQILLLIELSPELVIVWTGLIIIH